MPYINKGVRASVEQRSPQTVGELNYTITCVVRDYIRDKGLSYQTINDLMGALEGAKLEFYRRVASKYEDKKIEDNGDVYD